MREMNTRVDEAVRKLVAAWDCVAGWDPVAAAGPVAARDPAVTGDPVVLSRSRFRPDVATERVLAYGLG